MTLNTIAQLVALFYQGTMQPERFTTEYDFATMRLLTEKLSAGETEDLRGFRKVKGDGSGAWPVTDGVAAIPDDMMRLTTAYYKQGQTARRIRIVDDETFDYLICHPVEFPDAEHPICNVLSSGIRVRPVPVKYITITYIARPEPVTYAVDSSRGFAQFNEAGSSPVLWLEKDTPRLVQMILSQVGVSVDVEEIKAKQ